MSPEIKEARLRLVGQQCAPPARNQRPPRHTPGEQFLKGPVPWPWICAAARLPGRALHVGLAIWLAAGIQRRGTVAVNLTGVARELGFHPSTASRGLLALEKTGLVEVAGSR